MRSARTARTVTLGLDGDWTPPPYPPQQGGLLPGGPHGPRGHRALRLIMTAAAVAAGLCLIVWAVTLVAATDDTGPANLRPSQAAGTAKPPGGVSGPTVGPVTRGTPTPTGRQRQAGSHHQTGGHPRISGARNFPVGRTIAHYQGSGAGEPGPFHIRQPGVWGLSWSYRCPNGRPGSFVLGETRSWIGLAVSIDSREASAHGLYWVLGDSGVHSLVVASTCRWQLRVVQPAGQS